MQSPAVYYASLEEDRLHGDKPTDLFVEELVREYGSDLSHQLIENLQTGQSLFQTDLREYPLEIREKIIHFTKRFGQLPLWANYSKIKLAQQLFSTHGPEMILAALCSSIPYRLCCVQNQGSDVSFNSAAELQFFVDLLADQDFPSGENSALRSIMDKRMHYALVRKESSPDNLKSSVKPFNQEDLVAEILTYGAGVLQSLEHFGFEIHTQHKEAFIHYWNVIGYMMGVRQTLLPVSYTSALELMDDIFNHQARVSADILRNFREHQAFVDQLLTGNRLDGVFQALIKSTGRDQLCQILSIELTEKEITAIKHRLDLEYPDLQWLKKGSTVAKHLANLLSKNLLEGLLHYHHSSSHAVFNLPKERMPFWRSVQYSHHLPRYPQMLHLDEAIKLNEDLVHFLKLHNDSMGYFACTFQSVLLNIKAHLQSGDFQNQDLITELALKLSSRHFEVFNHHVNNQDPPFAWKLALDAHLTDSYYIDQYLLSSLAVHLTNDLLAESASAVGNLHLRKFRQDFELLYSLYRDFTPQFTDNEIINPSGLKLEINNLVLKKLKENFAALSFSKLWEQLKKISSAQAQQKEKQLGELETQALELSQSILFPSGLYHSVLKSYAKRETNHTHQLFKYLDLHIK